MTRPLFPRFIGVVLLSMASLFMLGWFLHVP